MIHHSVYVSQSPSVSIYTSVSLRHSLYVSESNTCIIMTFKCRNTIGLQILLSHALTWWQSVSKGGSVSPALTWWQSVSKGGNLGTEMVLNNDYQ